MPPPTYKVPIFILAGGYGTRMSEETQAKPKPMVEIGGIPILVHVMRSYYAFGFNDFIICGGYRCVDIKKFFLDYRYQLNDLELDQRHPSRPATRIYGNSFEEEKWRIRVLDTGLKAMTAARVARAFDKIHAREPFEYFGLTYGDGLTDVDLADEFRFHREHGAIGTVLGVKNLARFGELDIANEDHVEGFLEKPGFRQGFINGGFFFFKSVFRRYLSTDDNTVLEKEPLSNLASEGELRVYKHPGFWFAMDTIRDKNYLQFLWDSANVPWIPEPTDKRAKAA